MINAVGFGISGPGQLFHGELIFFPAFRIQSLAGHDPSTCYGRNAHPVTDEENDVFGASCDRLFLLDLPQGRGFAIEPIVLVFFKVRGRTRTKCARQQQESKKLLQHILSFK